TLTTSNVQDYKRLGITVSDYIGDVLDYAELDKDYLKDQGGEFDASSKKVIWKKIDIDANSQVQNSFRVKVKDPVPSTNSPSGTTTGFDCKISNEYGNEVTINIDCPIIKRIETLPNTGPGKSIFMMGVVTTIIGYFFARSRLLVKELDIVRTEYAMTGGM
ncbi:MAG TPA: hypothetical protein PKD20_03430, partial [Candidatus Saccharibacteria bacterium]|nr:hypothetical protein [Candidatus Saccharibacteria bacterium]